MRMLLGKTPMNHHTSGDFSLHNVMWPVPWRLFGGLEEQE
jgi:hypothetical protein